MATFRLRRGFDLPLAGGPALRVDDARAMRRVGFVAADHPGLKPALLVQPGTRVLRGTPIVEDRRSGVRHASPAAGTVAAVHRGERRALVSVTIDVGDDDGPDTQVALGHPAADAAAIEKLLVDAGLWAALRERPFGHVPKPGTRPAALFVTAIDTRPHAPEVALALQGREDDFARGVDALARMVGAPVHVCAGPRYAPPLPSLPNVRLHTFDGPHPAGLPGTHIHLAMPVDAARRAWHVGCQDVAAIGTLVATGRIDVSRVVSLAGPGVVAPRHLRTRLGASIDALVDGETKPGEQRVLSGSVLDGRIAQGDVEGWLGRYHVQVSALPEGRDRQLFGWISPAGEKFSLWPVVAGAVARRGLALSTSTNGGVRAMVPTSRYEEVMPLDLLPTFLLRALLTRDVERAEALGALELEEDDLALCTLVCPSKLDYGPLLREMLARLEAEGVAA